MKALTLAERISETADLVTVALDQLLPRAEGPEARLTEAMRYAALGPGRRLRPFFALETAKMFDLDEGPVLRAACALECIHASSLVHNDLPSMADDDERRGRPTVHKAYDEATASLRTSSARTWPSSWESGWARISKAMAVRASPTRMAVASS